MAKPQSTTVLNALKMRDISRERKSSLKRFPTKAEARFRDLLCEFRINHQFQKIVFTPHRYFILDFVLWLRPYAIVEIDGSAHTGRESADQRRTELVLKTKAYRGYEVIRLSNEQVFSGEAFSFLAERYPRQHERHFVSQTPADLRS